MSISYNGIGHFSVTFPEDGCTEGAVCKLSTDGEANACSAGDKLFGVVKFVDGGKACVLIEGFVTVSYTGTAPNCGWCNLSADGNGGVKSDSAGKEYLVAEVDTAAKTCVIKL